MMILICIAGYFACVLLAAYVLGRVGGDVGPAIFGPISLLGLAMGGLVCLVLLAFEMGEDAAIKKQKARRGGDNG